jgi:NAD-dependent deacetylase
MIRDLPSEITGLTGSAKNITVLTGAGMSAESGVPTFRDAQTGLWSRYDVAALATPDAWAADAGLVWAWYQWRAELVRGAKPNAGHLALAEWNANVRIITQNVDDLHERAGSANVEHLHGSLFAPRCSECGRAADVDPVCEPAERIPPPSCTHCASPVRPGVVWFGEGLPEAPWQAAIDAVENCDVLLVVGTSGVVYPAAGLPSVARGAGKNVIEINPVATDLTDQVDFSWRTTAALGLPAIVAGIG